MRARIPDSFIASETRVTLTVRTFDCFGFVGFGGPASLIWIRNTCWSSSTFRIAIFRCWWFLFEGYRPDTDWKTRVRQTARAQKFLADEATHLTLPYFPRVSELVFQHLRCMALQIPIVWNLLLFHCTEQLPSTHRIRQVRLLLVSKLFLWKYGRQISNGVWWIIGVHHYTLKPRLIEFDMVQDFFQSRIVIFRRRLWRHHPWRDTWTSSSLGLYILTNMCPVLLLMSKHLVGHDGLDNLYGFDDLDGWSHKVLRVYHLLFDFDKFWAVNIGAFF